MAIRGGIPLPQEKLLTKDKKEKEKLLTDFIITTITKTNNSKEMVLPPCVGLCICEIYST